MADDQGRRVELTEPVPADQRRVPRIGLGLLASLVIGSGPLRQAAVGSGSFPGAVARYLACLVASVGAALLLGRLLDSAPDPEPGAGNTPAPRAGAAPGPGPENGL